MSQKTLIHIQEILNSTNSSFRLLNHETIPKDSKGASIIRGTTHDHGAKALVLKTKSGKFIQAIVPANKRISLKKLRKIIEEKNVSLAHPDEVFSLTECIVGSVPPFGLLWNIEVYIDKTLLSIDEIVFSAGTLEDSIFIKPKILVIINNATVVNIIAEE